MITDLTPDSITGLAPQSTDFLGVVTTGGSGDTVWINTSPTASEVILDEPLGMINVNDVVGQDLDSLSGFGSNVVLWTYRVDLPETADAGTGLTNIQFNADMLFSNASMNNSSSDSSNRLTFELLLNDSTVGSVTHVAPVDGEGSITTLDHAGGVMINSAQVRVYTTNAAAFDSGTETFAVTNAILNAKFQATSVSEPSSASLLLIVLLGFCIRRRCPAFRQRLAARESSLLLSDGCQWSDQILPRLRPIFASRSGQHAGRMELGLFDAQPIEVVTERSARSKASKLSNTFFGADSH